MTTQPNGAPLIQIKPPQSREDYEAQGGRHAGAQVRINTGGYVSVTQQGGEASMQIGGYASGTARAFDDRFVEINGATVKRDVYEYLVKTNGIPPNAKIVDYAPEKSREVTGPFAEGNLEGNASQVTKNGAKEQQQKPEADPAVEAVFREGDAALEAARSQLGSAAVEEAINSAAMSGELTPPAGTSPKQVEAVIKAYTASAKEMIGDVGISIDDLSAALDDRELADARVAVVRGDTDRMRQLAAKSVDNLASMPRLHPDRFAEYIEGRFPDLDWKMEGERALVSVEGRGFMPWDTIVRMGWLSKAKAVPSKEGDA